MQRVDFEKLLDLSNKEKPGWAAAGFFCSDIVDWLSGCKYEFIPYLQNNWTLHVLTIVTFSNYDYNLPNKPFNQ